MDTLNKLIHIFNIIKKHNDEPVFNPPLTKVQVEQQLQSHEIPYNDLITDIYTLHNGIEHLTGFLSFVSLQELIEAHRVMGLIKNDEPAFNWHSFCLPLLSLNGGDAYILLDIEYGRLISIDYECDTEQVIAHHYKDYIDAICDVFDGDYWLFNEVSGCIEFDRSFWKQVCNKYHLKDAWM